MDQAQTDFDAKLQDFLNDITARLANAQKQLNDAVQAIIDKIAAQAPHIDLSAETAALETARVNFDSTVDSLPQNLPTTPTQPTGPTVAEAITGKGKGEAPGGSVQVHHKPGHGGHPK